MSKYVVLVPDGASDYPIEQLGNKTPLQVADMPNIKKLAASCSMGLAQTIPESFAAGSDVANLSILGYDPNKYFSGRGPIEAAYHGLKVGSNDTVFRCNLITIKDERILDYSAGHIETDEARQLIETLQQELGSRQISFFPGISYRHLTVFKDKAIAHLKTVAPHDVMGEPVEEVLPEGEGADLLINLIQQSQNVLKNHPVNKERQVKGLNPANSIWLWGSGQSKTLPSFYDRFGLTGGVISAVDLIKGLGVSIGLEALNVEGATGYFDTNYEAKAQAALEVLENNDFVYIHVEAPDEAGHIGNVEEKVKALENFDKRLVANLLRYLDLDQVRILLLPDHATPISVKTHTHDLVPFLIYPGDTAANNFSELEAKIYSRQIIEGHKLMDIFVKRDF